MIGVRKKALLQIDGAVSTRPEHQPPAGARSTKPTMPGISGSSAGVGGVSIHRFRHTFVINYLRNGGDPYSLYMMLGHSTMEMVKTYLAIAQADLERMNKKASPVENWRL